MQVTVSNKNTELKRDRITLKVENMGAEEYLRRFSKYVIPSPRSSPAYYLRY